MQKHRSAWDLLELKWATLSVLVEVSNELMLTDHIRGYLKILSQTLFRVQCYWKNLSLWNKQTAHWLCSLLSHCINRPLLPVSLTLKHIVVTAAVQIQINQSAEGRNARNRLPFFCLSYMEIPFGQSLVWGHLYKYALPGKGQRRTSKTLYVLWACIWRLEPH